MRPRGSLAVASQLDDLVTRLGRVEPETARRWGTLSSHEMLCHLSDAFLVTLGERPVILSDTWFSRTLVKWVAIHTSLPWPRGVPTSPEVDPHRRGTQPDVFDRDRQRVIELLLRFARPDTQYSRHPAFGPMTRAEWLAWGFAHVDHHLRQFGR